MHCTHVLGALQLLAQEEAVPSDGSCSRTVFAGYGLLRGKCVLLSFRRGVLIYE